MVVGKVEKGKLEKAFIKLNEIEFIEKEINVTNIISKEELIEKINEIKTEENKIKLIKIKLSGRRNFEIDIYELYKFINNEKIIKIKDETNINFDLEKLANETSLKGFFVKEMLQKLGNEEVEENRKIIEKAIEIGLKVLE